MNPLHFIFSQLQMLLLLFLFRLLQCSFAVGRFISILVSVFLVPDKMLFVNLVSQLLPFSRHNDRAKLVADSSRFPANVYRVSTSLTELTSCVLSVTVRFPPKTYHLIGFMNCFLSCGTSCLDLEFETLSQPPCTYAI